MDLFGRGRITVRAYLVLRSVMVFDALILIAVAALLAAFMERPAGIVGSALCFFGAGACLGGARWLDRVYDKA
jgi:hypothetical protein